MKNEIRIALVAARAENGIIGRSGDMPWRMPSDLRWFKTVTDRKPVIMGRKTFESIGAPLPGRTNIIVTRQGDYEAEGVLIVHGLERAFRIAEMDAKQNGLDELCVIGGGEIYAKALPKAARIYLTTIEKEIDGDTCFPTLNPEDWHIQSATRIEASDKDDHDARIEIWSRQLH
jgi:dihydrofolate reductase